MDTTQPPNAQCSKGHLYEVKTVSDFPDYKICKYCQFAISAKRTRLDENKEHSSNTAKEKVLFCPICDEYVCSGCFTRDVCPTHGICPTIMIEYLKKFDKDFSACKCYKCGFQSNFSSKIFKHCFKCQFDLCENCSTLDGCYFNMWGELQDEVGGFKNKITVICDVTNRDLEVVLNGKSMGHKTFAFGKPCVPAVLLGGQDYVIIS